MLHGMFRHPEAVVHVHTRTIMRRYMYLIVKRNAIMVCTFADDYVSYCLAHTLEKLHKPPNLRIRRPHQSLRCAVLMFVTLKIFFYFHCSAYVYTPRTYIALYAVGVFRFFTRYLKWLLLDLAHDS